MKPQVTLLASFTVAIGIVFFVHHNQNADRKVISNYKVTPLNRTPKILFFCAQRMREGVLRDIERQQRKEENKRRLEEQLVLEESLVQRDRGETANKGTQQL